MAIVTAVISGDHHQLELYGTIIDAMSDRVLPKACAGRSRLDYSDCGGILTVVQGRTENVHFRDGAVLAGTRIVSEEQVPWWRVGNSAPPGTFVLFRTGDNRLEVVSDYAGSRTIWRARLGCGGMVFSTCLEIVIALLGSFELDHVALGWYLSAGTCGPKRSWDARIKPVPQNTRVQATRSGSSIRCAEYRDALPKIHIDDMTPTGLDRAIRGEIERVDLGSSDWLLALSGGYDSRAMLAGLKGRSNISFVTWFDASKQHMQNTDLSIAEELARSTGHELIRMKISLPKSAYQLERNARRFVRYCDGRIDNFLAYVDGLAMWDELCELSAGGILRGDELFGTASATSRGHILSNMRLTSFSEFARSPIQRKLAQRYGHVIPSGLERREGETLGRWRWRLRSTYETPTVYAALNGIRARYFELSCPLLSGSLVQTAASLTDEALDDKKLYKSVVGTYFPSVGFASQRSILSWREFFALPAARQVLKEHLTGPAAREILGPRVASAAERALDVDLSENAAVKTLFRSAVRRSGKMMPARLRSLRVRSSSLPVLNLRNLALRSYLFQLFVTEIEATALTGGRITNKIKDISA